MCHKTHEIDVFFYEKMLFKTIWDVSHNSSIRQKLKCVIYPENYSRIEFVIPEYSRYS